MPSECVNYLRPPGYRHVDASAVETGAKTCKRCRIFSSIVIETQPERTSGVNNSETALWRGGSLDWFIFPAAVSDFAASSFIIRSLLTINPEVGDSSSRRREISLETAARPVGLETKATVKVVNDDNL